MTEHNNHDRDQAEREVSGDEDGDYTVPPAGLPDYAWTVEFSTDVSSGLKRFETEEQARTFADEYTERFGATVWILPTEQHQAMEADAGMPGEL